MLDARGGQALVGLNDFQRHRVTNRLTFENPAYRKAVELGQPTQGIAETILGYKEYEGAVIVPKHFETHLQSARAPMRELREFPKVITSRPRESQFAVVDALEAAYPEDVGLSLPCGFGKTFLALHFAQMFSGRVLIVCPTNVKLQEWRSEIQKHTGLASEEVGRVQADYRDWEDRTYTVTMLKTLATQNFPAEFLEGFDLVVWDEAHLCGAPVLSRALGRVRGTNLTLTATPGRGVRRKLIELHNGSNWISADAINKLTVSAYFQKVPVSNYIKSLDWRFQKIRLAKDRTYSDQARKHIDSAMDAGRRVLVLNSQVQPLAYLKSQFPNSGVIVGSGSLKEIAGNEVEKLFPEERSWAKKSNRYLQSVKEVANPILATGLTKTQPGGVGMDVADLDAGVIMFPVSCPDMTQQLVGRWQRYHRDKKDPILVVLVPDTQIGKAIAQKMITKLKSLNVNVFSRG